MTEPCESYKDGFCMCFDEDAEFEDLPAGCDEQGLCIDEFDDGCDDYAPADEFCGSCGEKYENCECEE